MLKTPQEFIEELKEFSALRGNENQEDFSPLSQWLLANAETLAWNLEVLLLQKEKAELQARSFKNQAAVSIKRIEVRQAVLKLAEQLDLDLIYEEPNW